MTKTIQLYLLPEEAATKESIGEILFQELGKQVYFNVVKRSIDARKNPVKIHLRIEYSGSPIAAEETASNYQGVHSGSEIHIIGFGSAGMFAALRCLEKGVKPIVYERGNDVQQRRRDLAAITKQGIVNPESNYCYGAGGAGTFSDGKLYTRSKKKGSIQSILQKLVLHGADTDILVNSHPHIGTNKLPKIISEIKETIIKYGGEIHFNTKVTDFYIEEGTLVGLQLNKESRVETQRVILATGHSARDIYELCKKRKISMNFKDFAVGFRIEHPQSFIDSIQYHCENRGEFLPPANYQLVAQVNGKGVFSFCMCPGGIIAPCATSPGEIVTNGWSPSKRNNPLANSGIVTTIGWDDVKQFHAAGFMAGIRFQQMMEKKAFELAGNNKETKEGQLAVAQKVNDFIDGKISEGEINSSYRPGVVSVDLAEIYPKKVIKVLKAGLVEFNKRMKGYLHKDAVLIGVETRTSSPVQFPRNENYEHNDVKGLYPCGEGAGYAGGIVSAAIDGENVVNSITSSII